MYDNNTLCKEIWSEATNIGSMDNLTAVGSGYVDSLCIVFPFTGSVLKHKFHLEIGDKGNCNL
jgi:hypothetical protein